MKAIVTGATGFVGKAVVEELLSRGIEVVAVVRNITKIPLSWKNNVSIIECSMGDYQKLKDEEVCYGADMVFHFAWHGTSGQDRAEYELQLNNVKNSCELLKVCEELHCVKFINAGSIMEYEVMEYLPQNKCNPGLGTIYSTAKLSADFMLKTLANNCRISYVNAIISNIYGEGEVSQRFINVMAKKLLNNEVLNLTHGKQMYDFIHISDAAKMFCIVGINGENGENYYIGNSSLKPLKDFVLCMKEELDSDSQLCFGAVPFYGAMLDYEDIEVGKIQKEFKFEPQVPFEMGIKRLADWLKSQK
jgi:nucleoside-diphosphate-sugar epimerase